MNDAVGANWIKVLDDSKNAVDVAYHVLMGRYQPDSKEVYAIVEGKDDNSFYKHFIERELPDSWSLWLWPAGGKSKVLQCYGSIDWSRFRKERLCFFVDRDFSSWLEESTAEDKNVYVSDGYSIENSVIDINLLLSTFKEIYGIFDLSIEEHEHLRSHIREQLEEFCNSIQQLTAQMVLWRKGFSTKANFNNIQLCHFFDFSTGRLSVANSEIILDEISRQVGCRRSTAREIELMSRSLPAGLGICPHVRGKFLLWFSVGLMRSTATHFSKVIPRVKKRLKARVDFNSSSAILILGPRARCPATLSKFIRRNYNAYIRSSLN